MNKQALALLNFWSSPPTLCSPTGFIRPKQNLPQLEQQILELNRKQPFTLVIDLTRGKLSSALRAIKSIPTWNNFSIGRIREATDINLPTSGHLISHNQDEIREALANQNLSNVLVLDDTSFSGSTSLIMEDLIQKAFPDQKMAFTHGFLILNHGELGPNPGAKTRLKQTGSQAIGGMKMSTPKDDGWHFFDLLNQHDLENHLIVVKEILGLIDEPDFTKLASNILANEDNLRLMFPKFMTKQAIENLRESGHFISNKKLNGGFHVRNPQLMPNIIGQGHLAKMDQWLGDPEEAFALLLQINELLKKGKNEK